MKELNQEKRKYEFINTYYFSVVCILQQNVIQDYWQTDWWFFQAVSNFITHISDNPVYILKKAPTEKSLSELSIACFVNLYFILEMWYTL